MKSNLPFRLGSAGSAEDDRVMLVECDEAGEVRCLKVVGGRDQER